MKKLKNRWLHANTIRRIFAGEVVALHPFHKPPGLFEATQAVVESCQPDRQEMIRIRSVPLFLKRLGAAISALPICARWNRPRRGKHKFVFVSRYDRPRPECDFIDIDALRLNICREVGKDLATDDDFPPQTRTATSGVGKGSMRGRGAAAVRSAVFDCAQSGQPEVTL